MLWILPVCSDQCHVWSIHIFHVHSSHRSDSDQPRCRTNLRKRWNHKIISFSSKIIVKNCHANLMTLCSIFVNKASTSMDIQHTENFNQCCSPIWKGSSISLLTLCFLKIFPVLMMHKAFSMSRLNFMSFVDVSYYTHFLTLCNCNLKIPYEIIAFHLKKKWYVYYEHVYVQL